MDKALFLIPALGLMLLSLIPAHAGSDMASGDYEDWRSLEKAPIFCIITDQGNTFSYDEKYVLLTSVLKGVVEWDDAVRSYNMDWYWGGMMFDVSLVEEYSIFDDCDVHVFLMDGFNGSTLGKAVKWGDSFIIYIYPDGHENMSDVSYTMMHEMGHVFGLGHSDNIFSIMQRTIEAQKKYNSDGYVPLIDASRFVDLYDGYLSNHD